MTDTSSSTTVSVIDTATNTLAITIMGCNDPHDVTITPDGTRADVVNDLVTGTVSVIIRVLSDQVHRRAEHRRVW